MDKSKLKSNIILITYAILLFMLIQHFEKVGTLFGHTLSLILPFIYGFIIAYLLHRPFNFFYNKVFNFQLKRGKYLTPTLKKVLSLVCVYVATFMLFVTILSLLIPELATSVSTLISEVKQNYPIFIEFTTNLFNQFELTSELWKQLEIISMQVFKSVMSFIYNSMPSIVDSVINITGGITNFIFGIIISVYLLSSKDKLTRQAKQLTLAFLPEKLSSQIIRITKLTHKTFSGFITGQLLDAFILGSMCFVGMVILRMPYALLVSVIIGSSNIIPILGPILGAVPTTFIILMADPTDPMKAVWFVVYIIVLQQIDGNFIYPRVVGSSIGLSGLWVLFAILVFGSQFGVIGMIIGVPTCAVAYILLREATYKRLRKKNIPIVSEDSPEH